MLFSSITFIYYFLPITLILYFAMPVGHGRNPLRGKNSLLLLASFLFYAMGEPRYVLLMLASVIIGYFGGLAISKFPYKITLASFLVAQLSLLGIFKYTDFVITTWNQVMHTQVSLRYFILPIGISFYSFQIISYLVDVYRKEISCENDFIDFAAYITMFPQLIAGPIVRYKVVQPQMKQRKIALSNVSDGATRFLIGLGKKVLLADNIGELLLRIEGLDDKSFWSYWLIALMYVLQLYYDFSGYSDMAIGLGKMLGFYFPENFDYPLTANSITEFWRRWHISLGTFLKDYIYIPLKGSRCSKARWAINIGVVWFLSGLWHGASWNFVLWGLYFGVFLILEKLGRQLEWFPRKNICQKLYMWIVVIISFVLFRFTDLGTVQSYLKEMLHISNYAVSALEWYEYRNVAFLVIIGMVGTTPLVANVVKQWREKLESERVAMGTVLLFQMVMLVVVTAYLIQSSVHPFLYFRF